MTDLVILDTNVWISGLFWKGVPGGITDKIYSHELTTCFSLETYKEWEKKVRLLAEITNCFPIYLQYKKFLQKYAFFVFPKEKIDICRDSKDNKFLEVATTSSAELLITGDRDLLILKKFGKTQIISPIQFLKIFP